MTTKNRRSETKVHTRMNTVTLSPMSRSYFSTLAVPSPPAIVFSSLLLHSSSRSPRSVSPHLHVSFPLLPSFPPRPHVSFPPLPSFPPRPHVSFPPLPSFLPPLPVSFLALHVSFPPQPAPRS